MVSFCLSASCLAFLTCTISGVVSADAQVAQPKYANTHAVAVGAPERWDYLTFDPTGRRLYLSHGDRVDVLDGRTGAILGRVSGIPGGTHGIGVVRSLGKGYTDDGKNGEVVVFDLRTLKVLHRVAGTPDADGIVVDPKTQRVFVINGDSGSVTVIDPRVDKVIATVSLGGGLEFGVADGLGRVYINGEEKREMLRINTRTLSVDARWPIPDCESAHGLAIDTDARRLFVSCLNRILLVLDADSGAVVATLPIGRGTDAVAFDPLRKLIFSSNGIDGTISVIRENSPQSYAALDDIKSAVSGRTMTIDPATGRLYVAAAAIDPMASATRDPNGRPVRPKPLPDSLKVLFLDPQDSR